MEAQIWTLIALIVLILRAGSTNISGATPPERAGRRSETMGATGKGGPMTDVLQCPYCELRFTSRSELEQHKSFDHPEEKRNEESES